MFPEEQNYYEAAQEIIEMIVVRQTTASEFEAFPDKFKDAVTLFNSVYVPPLFTEAHNLLRQACMAREAFLDQAFAGAYANDDQKKARSEGHYMASCELAQKAMDALISVIGQMERRLTTS